MNATVSFTSIENSTTTFTIHLPLESWAKKY
jgi:hypothetical protein